MWQQSGAEIAEGLRFIDSNDITAGKYEWPNTLTAKIVHI